MDNASGSGGQTRRISGETWAAHKNMIYALYIEKNKTLNGVLEVLRAKHNFFPR